MVIKKTKDSTDFRAGDLKESVSCCGTAGVHDVLYRTVANSLKAGRQAGPARVTDLYHVEGKIVGRVMRGVETSWIYRYIGPACTWSAGILIGLRGGVTYLPHLPYPGALFVI